MSRSILPFVLALPLLAVASPAHASYPSTAKWSSAPTLNIQRSSSISSAWYDEVEAAIDIVNLGSFGTWVSVVDDDDTTVADANGESELAFTSSNALLCGTGADGCAWTWAYSSDANKRYESDVYLDSTVSWDTDRLTTDIGAYGGSQRPLATTTIHEIGHFLGLDHESRYYNVMGKDFEYMTSNGTEYFPTLGEDATTGLVTHYGYASGYEDLAVSHWKWDQCAMDTVSFMGISITYCSGYSDHKRVRVLDSTGAELPSSWSSSEPTYTATKGSWLKAEVTLENNGAVSQRNTVQMYLSSLRQISPSSSTSIGSSTVTATPNVPDLLTIWIALPSTLKSGSTYYIGAGVDASGTLTEVNEDNNYAYLAAVKIK